MGTSSDIRVSNYAAQSLMWKVFVFLQHEPSEKDILFLRWTYKQGIEKDLAREMFPEILPLETE